MNERPCARFLVDVGPESMPAIGPGLAAAELMAAGVAFAARPA
jgi:hypothetical protein